jgi:hypothetical protein
MYAVALRNPQTSMSAHVDGGTGLTDCLRKQIFVSCGVVRHEVTSNLHICRIGFNFGATSRDTDNLLLHVNSLLCMFLNILHPTHLILGIDIVPLSGSRSIPSTEKCLSTCSWLHKVHNRGLRKLWITRR